MHREHHVQSAAVVESQSRTTQTPNVYSPIFEASLGDSAMEGGLSPLEPDPLGTLPCLRTFVPFATSLPRARAISPTHSLSVPSGTLVGTNVVQPQR